ncbi:YdcH family protein [Silvibacterium acidisoli]|uniref:YdcH family protein n=1 Tax=Acidobacteriaceae bacterium ZG23-2 TaxID=2883246 RepID=UPI00406C8D13
MDLESKSRSANTEIDRLEAQHRQYSQQLESLTQKPYLSDDEQIEEVRLKKLKLRVKDQITARRGMVV